MQIMAQGSKEDFYYEIPDYPEKYTAETVAARLVDGLGFRYYWGTSDLSESDLLYRPSDSARNVIETIDHIFVLTQILADATNEKSYNGVNTKDMSFKEKRDATLANIQIASKKLKSCEPGSLEKMEMIFISSGSEYPFWNLINGPIADAINHVGQVISMRRSNGNPINPNISVLSGKVKE
jgi:hypothetical protein